MILRTIKTIIVFSLLLPSTLFAASSISLDQVTKDVTALAGDDMKGRKTFSPEIDKAADYIAKRFQSIGLKHFAKATNFKQSFALYQVTPNSLSVALDGKIVEEKNAFALTNFTKLEWTEKSNIKQIAIDKDADFRQSMQKVNQLNTNVIVHVDPAHKETFTRFKQYFSRGKPYFKTNNGVSAVFIVNNKASAEKFSIVATTNKVQQKLTNVVAVLPGKSKANEYVLFSAHYDHLGESGKDGSDKIYNGADDDASGTAAVINLAQHFATQASNERTLVFVAFTAEEIGGYGSKYFSEQLDPNSVIAMINIEMIGKPSKFGAGSFWMTGFERSNLGEILNENLSDDKQVFPDPYPKQNLFYRSDNATLARLGVPAHSFSSSQIDKDTHYHQVSDEVGTLDLESMHLVIQGIANAVEPIVDGSRMPTRVDTSKVKSTGSFY